MSKISIGNMNQIIKNTKFEKVVYPVDIKDKTYNIEFTYPLTLEDENKFISRIVGMAFDGTTYEYLPQYAYIGKYIALLQYMSNVEIPVVESTDEIDVDKCKEFIEKTFIDEQLNRWYKETYQEPTGSLYKGFVDYVYNLFDMADEKIESIKAQKYSVGLNTILTSQTDLNNQLSNVADTLKKFLDSAINGLNDFTEEIRKEIDKQKADNTKVDSNSERKNESKDNITEISEVKSEILN